MFDLLKMRVAQIADVLRTEGWSFLRKQVAYLNRSAIVVEKKLAEIVDRPVTLAAANLQVVEFDRDSVAFGAYRFALLSRQLKTLHFLKQGYSGFGLVRGDLVVGDMWYCFSETETDPKLIHSDLGRLGFTQWDRTSVYTFDIFVVPAERKSGVAAAFQNTAMLALRAKGFRKGYGFYWADNLQAHWCTRVMNKWNRIRTVKISRFLILRIALPAAERGGIPTTA
jgi:hypothetical protein